VAEGRLDEALRLPVGEGDAAVLRRMILLLRLAESRPNERLRALVLAEPLFAANPQVPQLQDVYTRLTRQSGWETIAAVQASAGLRQVMVTGAAPESPTLRVRKALGMPLPATDQLVTGFDRFLLSLKLLRPTLLTLYLTLEDVAHLPPVPLTAVYQLDDGSEHKVKLTPQAPSRKEQLLVPEGAHSLRVWIDQPLANQALRVRFEEFRPDLAGAERVGSVLGGSAAMPAGPGLAPIPPAAVLGPQNVRPDRFLGRTTPREYHIATAAQPVQLRIEGPAWLRFDELRGDVTYTRALAVGPGLRTITVKLEPGQKEALFRIFRRALAPELPVTLPRYIPIEPIPVPPPELGGEVVRWWGGGVVPGLTGQGVAGPCRDLITSPPHHLTTQPAVLFDDAYRLGTQEKGTWSVTAEYQHRRALEEDNSGVRAILKQEIPDAVLRKALEQELKLGAPDVFGELRGARRYYDEWCRVYYETDVLGRVREESGPTFGVREHIRYDPDCIPLFFHLEGSGYVQRPAGVLVPGTDKVEGSGLLRGWVNEYREITPELGHEPTVLVFGRLLSREEVAYRPGFEDQDVFTRWKAQHRWGVELSDTLVYAPSLDNRWWGRVAVMSNEEIVTPDHVAAWAGYKQLLGDLQVNVGYEFLMFFRNEDRNASTSKHLFDLEVTGYVWPWHRDRMEIGVGWQHDFTRHENSINVYLTWFFGNNRRFLDFRPDEVDFRDLRERRAAESVQNNHVWPGD
jgi:hypothetical protein